MQPTAVTLGEVAEDAARLGGEVARDFFRGDSLEVESKAEHDFVTAADRASEAKIVARIHQQFPEHDILAEEAGALGVGAEHQWIIDPLDGTTNFLEGLPLYAVSVACQYRDEVVAGAIYDPENKSLFSATVGSGARWNGRPMSVSRREGVAGCFLATGFPFKAREALPTYLEVFADVFLAARAIRRCGAAALDLAYTAAGVFDGFFEFRLAPWDVAAGALLVREAGGRVSDLDGGERFMETGNILAGPPDVHTDLLSIVGRHVSEEDLDLLTGA